MATKEGTRQADPIITIESGRIKGIYLESRGGCFYVGFMGIPYADPPKRFQLSQPVTPWRGTRDTTAFSPSCLQWSSNTIKGVEDSLTVNVFVPTHQFQNGNLLGGMITKMQGFFHHQPNPEVEVVPVVPKLPVIVWIHGGRFQSGCSSDNGPEYILDENVIFVSLNYRLNAFGFLTTGDDNIPGNLGLKDQVLALKWVQKNISRFGGDPALVALYGESAGAACVSLHVVSPLSRGLFQKAICCSGSCLDEWVLQRNPTQNAFDFVQKLNRPCRTTAEIKDVLISASLEDISRIAVLDASLVHNPWLVAVIEPEGPDAFLPDSPREQYRRGDFSKIPILYTVNAQEGLSKSAKIMTMPDMLNSINENWYEMAPELYHYEHLSEDLRRTVSERLHTFYYGNRIPIVTQESFMNFTDAFSDILFIFGVREAVISHALHAPTYAGVIDISGNHSNIINAVYPKPLGVAHADDLQYVFNCHGTPKIGPDSEVFVASHRLVRMFANFAKFWNPNYDQKDKQWDPVSRFEVMTRDLKWVYIRNNECVTLMSLLDQRMKFCDEFYQVVGFK